MQNTVLRYSSIIVPPRLRKDYGDLETLSESIRTMGLIQPLVVRPASDGHFELVAGGRRHAAIGLLREASPDTFSHVPVYCMFHLLEDDETKLVELEENLRRKDMSWQEVAIGIAEVHRARYHKAALTGTDWICAQTGDLFGVHRSYVQNALQIADALEAGDDEILKCENASTALALILTRKRKEIESYKAALQKAAVTARKAVASVQTAAKQLDDLVAESLETAPPDPTSAFDELDAYAYAMDTVLLGDSIEYMDSLAANSFDHIYTDIPYGIDMDNLEIKEIGETADQHDRDSNIQLFEPFLDQAYRLVRPGGFCVFWCDIEHFSHLTYLAKTAGFRVQRWPLIGVKSGPCKNSAASFNCTKDYEILMVCAKTNGILHTKRSTSIVPFSWESGERQQYAHPFVKPFNAHKHIIETFIPPDQTFFDPFCGEGTGVVAGLRLGRRPTGMDLVESHVNRAREHVKQYLCKPAIQSLVQAIV